MEIDEESNIGRDDCDENDMDFLLIIAQCIINNNIALIQCLRRRRCKQQHFCRQCAALQILLPPDHRHLPRQAKADFQHGEAFLCIKRDYFGIPGDSLTPIFKDRTFQMMFRVCWSCVQIMLEDTMTTNHPFYVKSVDAAGKRGHVWRRKFCCHSKPSHMESHLIPSLIISKCQRDLLQIAAMILLQL
jgi:hypothetical protein